MNFYEMMLSDSNHCIYPRASCETVVGLDPIAELLTGKFIFLRVFTEILFNKNKGYRSKLIIVLCLLK